MANNDGKKFAAHNISNEHLYESGGNCSPQLYDPKSLIEDQKLFEEFILDLTGYIPYGFQYPETISDMFSDIQSHFPWVIETITLMNKPFDILIQSETTEYISKLYDRIRLPGGLTEEEIIRNTQGIHTTSAVTRVGLYKKLLTEGTQVNMYPAYLDCMLAHILLIHLIPKIE